MITFTGAEGNEIWEEIAHEINAMFSKIVSYIDCLSAEMLSAKEREAAFRNYAALLNHARPRGVSWRRLNRQQKVTAIFYYHKYVRGRNDGLKN